MNNVIKKILRLIAVCAQGLILVLGVTLIMIQSAAIQTFLINKFAVPENHEVTLSGLRGVFPFNFAYDAIELKENNAAVLTIKNLDVDFSVLKSLRLRRVGVERFAAEAIVYYELAPVKELEPKDKSFSLPTIPVIPFVEIQDLQIDTFKYVIKDKAFLYNIKGGSSVAETGSYNFEFSGNNLTSSKVGFGLKGVFTPEDEGVTLKLWAKESGGVLNYLMAKNGVFSVDLNIEGKKRNLKGSLSFVLEDQTFNGSFNSALNTEKGGYTFSLLGKYNVSVDSYDIGAEIFSDKRFQTFNVKKLNLSDGKQRTLLVEGLVSRRGNYLTTKNLKTTLSASKELQLVLNNTLNLNLATSKLTHTIKGEASYQQQKIADVETVLALDSTLKNALFNFDVVGNLSSLYKGPAELAQFKLQGSVDSNALNNGSLVVPFIIEHVMGNLAGSFSYVDAPRFKVAGEVLQNTFDLNAELVNSVVKVVARNKTQNDKQRIVPNELELRVGLERDRNVTLKHKITVDKKRIDVEAKGAFSEDYLNLAIASFKAMHKESFLEVSGDIALDGGSGALDWHFYSFNLGDLFDGAVSGTLSTIGRYELEGEDPILNFKGDFHKVAAGGVLLKKGNLSGFLNLKDGSDLNFSFNAKQGSFGEVLVEDFSLNANGALDNFAATLSMVGYAEQALKGNVAFSVLNMSSIDLDSVVLTLGKDQVMLRSPTKIAFSGNSFKIDPTVFNTTRGEVSVLGELLDENLSFELRLKKISSELLYHLTRGQYFLTGEVNSDLTVRGTLDNPQLDFRFTTLADEDTTTLSAKYMDGEIASNVKVKTKNLNLDGSAVVPVLVDLKALSWGLKQDRQFKIKLKAEGDLKDINRFLDLKYDKFYGNLSADLELSGLPSNKIFKGYVRLDGGAYKRESLGLVLKDINLMLDGKGNKLILRSPTAFTDEANKGKGYLEQLELHMPSDKEPVLTAALRFEKMQLVSLPQTRSGGMSVLASGSLGVTGPFSALSIYLRGDVNSLEKYIGSIDSVPVYKVNLQHKKIASDTTAVQPPSAPQDTSGVRYDIELNLKNKFRIFGQGLESGWQGSLAIKGDSLKPIYKGAFVLKEGTFRVLDKVFKVQKGNVEFDGDLSPTLYVEAGLNLPDMRVSVVLESNDDNVTQRITSDQDLTEQEILQKLFFNRSSTVSQSLQVMNLLASQSFISSLVDVGFYQETNPITHKDYEYLSLKRKLTQKSYVNVDVNINNDDGLENKVSISMGYNFNKDTKAKLNYAPGEKRLGIALEWDKDF